MPYSYRNIGGVLISLLLAIESTGGYGTDSVMLGQTYGYLLSCRALLLPLAGTHFPSHPTEGRRLSGPKWLVTYQGCISVNSDPDPS